MTPRMYSYTPCGVAIFCVCVCWYYTQWYASADGRHAKGLHFSAFHFVHQLVNKLSGGLCTIQHFFICIEIGDHMFSPALDKCYKLTAKASFFLLWICKEI